MSLLSSITGQDSAKAASKQSKANQGIQSKYAQLFQGAAQDYDFLNKMLGNADIQGFLDAQTNALNESTQSKTQKFSNQANSQAATQANQTAMFLKSQGFGDGLTAGAGANAFQQAATQTNQYAQQLEDPQEQLRQLMAYLQGIGGVQNLYLNPLQSFASGAYGAPQVQQGSPFLSLLGQIAGAGASAYSTSRGGR